jgi:CheY-like chemotaxis protein
MKTDDLIKKADELYDSGDFSSALMAYDDAIQELYKDSIHASESDERMSRLLVKKGICAAKEMDFSLAGTIFEAAISSLPVSSHFGEPYFYLSVLQCGWGLPFSATIDECLKRDMSVIERWQVLLQPMSFIFKTEGYNRFVREMQLLGGGGEQIAEREEPELPPHDGAPYRVLVVESDMHIRKYFVDTLKEKNYVVDAFEKSQEGLDAAHDTPYDVIVYDLSHSTIEVEEVFKKLKTTANVVTPVLVGVHMMAESLVKRAFTCGAYDYVLRMDPMLDPTKSAADGLLQKVESAVSLSFNSN